MIGNISDTRRQFSKPPKSVVCIYCIKCNDEPGNVYGRYHRHKAAWDHAYIPNDGNKLNTFTTGRLKFHIPFWCRVPMTPRTQTNAPYHRACSQAKTWQQRIKQSRNSVRHLLTILWIYAKGCIPSTVGSAELCSTWATLARPHLKDIQQMCNGYGIWHGW